MGTAAYRWGLAAAGAVAAGVVFWFAASAHLRSACEEMDTPYLPLCAEQAADDPALLDDLKRRIARNPGDSTAWTKLLVSEPPADAPSVLPGAVLAAPHNHNVARWRAADALQKGRLDEGVDLMVQILRHRYSLETARLIAQAATTPQGFALLRPHLASAREWLPQVLNASDSLKQPLGEMLPLVAAAASQNALPDSTRQSYMRSLKASGQWLDAYGLWVSQHKDTVPLLFNGGFDTPFELDGFDWEFTRAPRSRAGLVIEQEVAARRGLVLDIEFTRRPFTAPVLRQYLFLPPGVYRLRGEYMATKLRSEEGLAWSVQCTTARKQVVGRSESLKDTGGIWKPVEFDFTVTSDCGAVASLQLDPVAGYEATTGLKGGIAFDAFSLTRTPASQ